MDSKQIELEENKEYVFQGSKHVRQPKGRRGDIKQ